MVDLTSLEGTGMTCSARFILMVALVAAMATGVVIGLVASDPPAPRYVIDNVPMSVWSLPIGDKAGRETQVCPHSRYARDNSTNAYVFGGEEPTRTYLGPSKRSPVMNSALNARGKLVWYKEVSPRLRCAHFTAPRPGHYQIVFVKGDEILEIDNFTSMKHLP